MARSTKTKLDAGAGTTGAGKPGSKYSKTSTAQDIARMYPNRVGAQGEQNRAVRRNLMTGEQRGEGLSPSSVRRDAALAADEIRSRNAATRARRKSESESSARAAQGTPRDTPARLSKQKPPNPRKGAKQKSSKR